MEFWGIILFVAAIWIALSMTAALIIGRSIRDAEIEEIESREVIHLHADAVARAA